MKQGLAVAAAIHSAAGTSIMGLACTVITLSNNVHAVRRVIVMDNVRYVYKECQQSDLEKKCSRTAGACIHATSHP